MNPDPISSIAIFPFFFCSHSPNCTKLMLNYSTFARSEHNSRKETIRGQKNTSKNWNPICNSRVVESKASKDTSKSGTLTHHLCLVRSVRTQDWRVFLLNNYQQLQKPRAIFSPVQFRWRLRVLLLICWGTRRDPSPWDIWEFVWFPLVSVKAIVREPCRSNCCSCQILD